MSDAVMLDAELDDCTDDHTSPPPFKFILSPGIWSMCQARPFRFLDLPPELRNRIYEQAFTGAHGLSPHHLTQVNRQIASEAAQMFRTETHTLQIPLHTPKQMTRFLNWMSDGVPGFSHPERQFEFTYTDIDVGTTTIRFTQVCNCPATVFAWVRSSLGYSERDALLCTWHILLGLHYERLLEDFHKLLMLEEPSSLFIEAIINGSTWEYYMMEFVGERQPWFPPMSYYAQEFFLHFIRMLVLMSNEEWDEKFVRGIAGFLFMRSMQARTKA